MTNLIDCNCVVCTASLGEINSGVFENSGWPVNQSACTVDFRNSADIGNLSKCTVKWQRWMWAV